MTQATDIAAEKDDRSKSASVVTSFAPLEQPPVSFLKLMVGVAAVAVVLAIVHLSSTIIAQFLMAFVIAVAVAPAQGWLIRRGVRPAFAFLITVVSMLVALGLAITVLSSSLSRFIGDLPQYQEQFAQLQKQVTAALESLGFSQPTVETSSATGNIAQAVAEVATWLVGAFANFGFMLALAAFMLLEATAMPAKLRAIVLPAHSGPLDRFTVNIRTYVVVTAWVNLLVAIVDTVLLLLLGVPYAALWGGLAFLLGFIPSIGFLLSLVGPALMALLESGPQAALVVIVAFVVINGGIQNIVLPRRMGEGTDLSPAVVFGSLLFWGYVLGPVGAILSVPMTMIVRLALDSSDSTRGLSYLMSSGQHPYRRANSETEEDDRRDE